MTMVRRILIANEKGGVGKTTTAVNLAHGLALLLNKKVLLVDFDNQAGATISLGFAPSDGTYDLLVKESRLDDVKISARENLDLLPSGQRLSLALSFLESLERDLKHGGVAVARGRLKAALQNDDEQYDFVIVDSGPGLNILSLNGLTYGEEVLIPVSLDFLSEVGTEPFIRAIATMRSYNAPVRLRYIVPTLYHTGHKYDERILERLKNNYKELVTKPIRRNTDIAAAPEYGKTIFEYNRRSAGSQDYETLTRRVSNG
jgi:chromosome partitioning protein